MKSILMIGLALMTPLTAQVPVEVVVLNKFVTGAPFSAVAVTESTQTLADGNRIAHKSQEKLYRDSQGRERRESEGRTFTVLGQQMAAADVVIFDPATHASCSFNLQGNTATKGLAPGSSTSVLQRAMLQPEPGARIAAVIEGLAVQGTRTTSTIPAGRIGNERDILVVDEVWYSRDLQMNLITKRSDPRSGETVLRITNISRSEPDPALFLVPAGYTIKAQTQPLGARQFVFAGEPVPAATK
jgi:hypothetical protein